MVICLKSFRVSVINILQSIHANSPDTLECISVKEIWLFPLLTSEADPKDFWPIDNLTFLPPQNWRHLVLKSHVFSNNPNSNIHSNSVISNSTGTAELFDITGSILLVTAGLICVLKWSVGTELSVLPSVRFNRVFVLSILQIYVAKVNIFMSLICLCPIFEMSWSCPLMQVMNNQTLDNQAMRQLAWHHWEPNRNTSVVTQICKWAIYPLIYNKMTLNCSYNN